MKLTSIGCSECDKEDAMSFERNNALSAVLEIGKFGPGSTPASTPRGSPPLPVKLFSQIFLQLAFLHNPKDHHNSHHQKRNLLL